MDRNEALALLKEHVTTESLLGHCLATAAVMKGLAKELGEDENLYELIGILHDIDFQEINEDMEKHGARFTCIGIFSILNYTCKCGVLFILSLAILGPPRE